MHRAWNVGCSGLMLATLLLLACPLVAFARSGNVLTLPMGAKGSVAGLSLEVDTEWAEGRGYRPITLRVACSPAVAVDRTLNIELGIGGYSPRKTLVIPVDVEIPAGSTKVSKVVTVPQYNPMQWLSLDTWEDGRRLEGLSIENHYMMTGGMGMGMWDAELPSILFVTPRTPAFFGWSVPTSPDVSQFSFLNVDGRNVVNRGSNPGGVQTTLQVSSFAECRADELVEEWLNYSSLDMIFLSLPEAQSLATKKPKVWQAVREWTWAGGTLCLYGAGADWKGLEAIERVAMPSANVASEQPLRGWQKPDAELYGKRYLPGAVSAAQTEADDEEQAGKSTTRIRQQKTAPASPPFLFNKAMLGRVVAIAATSPFPGRRAEWQWMFACLGPTQPKWRYRHGLSPDGDNPGFDNMLIADIGLPPVRSYRVLITLFVIVIGPLNYWLLRRKGRLHLLLFTVPVAAVLASTGLIGYVVVADGLSARVRARTLTLIDQQADESVTWSRLSYYCGLAPSGGLTFPADTAVYPLEKTSSWNAFIGGKRRELEWTPDQHLTRGWLGARTPTQFLTVRPHATKNELKFVASDGNQATVENRLGTDVEQLLLCDEAGKLHYGTGLRDGQRAKLQRLASPEAEQTAKDKFRGVFERDAPRMPETFDETDTYGLFGMFRSRPFRYRNQSDDHSTASSVLENELLEVATFLHSAQLPPRTYLAIVQRPPDVSYGSDSMHETQTLHVVRGKW